MSMQTKPSLPPRRGMQDFFQSFAQVWPIYAAAAAAYWILSASPQIHEIYLIFALNFDHSLSHIVLAYVTLVGMGLAIWVSGRLLLPLREQQPASANVGPFLWRISICVAALAPIMGAAAGMAEAKVAFDLGKLRQTLDALKGVHDAIGVSPAIAVPDALLALNFTQGQLLETGVKICQGLAAGLLCVLLIVELAASLGHGKLWRASDKAAHLLLLLLLGGGLLSGAVFCLQGLMATDPAAQPWVHNAGAAAIIFAQELGVLSILNIFLGTLLLMLSLALRVYRRVGIPILAILFALALFASTFDLNDNHTLRVTKQSTGDVNFLTERFNQWLHVRERYRSANFADKPYPVYIVAARGGGIYAANHVALFLARMRDTCPRFAQHLFAVSAVSGGSLGAAVYSSLAREAPFNGEAAERCDATFTTPGPIEVRARDYLTKDFLSPISAATLFPDFIQLFVPWPIRTFDRSLIFEASLESNWAQRVSPKFNPMRAPFLEHWQDYAKAPMLALHATLVEFGFQVVVSPLTAIDQSGDAGVRFLPASYILGQDIPLSTAVSLSSRYPGLMPPASIDGGSFKWRFVDGAYYDNSGMETAQNMARVLRSWATARGQAIDVRIVALVDQHTMLGFREGLAEFLTPVRTMLRTWSLRAQLNVRRAIDQACPTCAFLGRNNDYVAPRRIAAMMQSNVQQIQLSHDFFRLPLGWHLSRFNQEIIGSFVGTAERCVAGPQLKDMMGQLINAGEVTPLEFFQMVNENNCVACSIVQKVRGSQPQANASRPCSGLNHPH